MAPLMSFVQYKGFKLKHSVEDEFDKDIFAVL